MLSKDLGSFVLPELHTAAYARSYNMRKHKIQIEEIHLNRESVGVGEMKGPRPLAPFAQLAPHLLHLLCLPHSLDPLDPLAHVGRVGQVGRMGRVGQVGRTPFIVPLLRSQWQQGQVPPASCPRTPAPEVLLAILAFSPRQWVSEHRNPC